jgi:hypothetical protein
LASWPSVWRVGRPTGLAVARESGRRRRSDHEHRRARLSRHALALLPHADGGEAAGPRRDCGAPGCGRREAQGGSRAAGSDCDVLSITGGSVIARRETWVADCLTMASKRVHLPLLPSAPSLVRNSYICGQLPRTGTATWVSTDSQVRYYM